VNNLVFRFTFRLSKITQAALAFNIVMPSNHLSGYETDLKQILDQIRMLVDQIHQSFELSEMLNIIVTEVRKTLETDRAIIYRFLPDGDGVIASESVNRAWKPILGQLIYDPCFNATWVERYRDGCVGVIEDINTKKLDPCYKKLLTDLQIRANLVVPILVNNQEIDGVTSKYPHLWGLLIAHQCTGPHQWSSLEIEYLQLIAAELGIALGEAERHQRRGTSSQKLTPQLNQNPKNLTVQPKLKLRSIKRTLYKNFRESFITRTALPKNISVADLIAFDRLQTPVWIYDIQNLQMWWANQSALHIWNAQSREELLNRNFSDVSESTHTRMQSYLEEFQQGKTITENWTFYPKGKPFSARCLFSGIQIEQGRMAMLVEGTTEVINQIDQETLRSKDITKQQVALQERQRGEEELRWREALLRSITDTSLLGFFVVDNRTDEILYFNHRFCEIWGIEHLEAQMRLGALKNNDIIPDCIPSIADVPAFAESCKPLQSEENRCTIEDEILFVDGRTIRRLSSQIPDTQDRYFGRLYIFEDITPRKQIETALKTSEEKWQYALEGNGDGVWDFNAETNEIFFSVMAEGIILQQSDGQITACNNSAERILELKADQMMGRTSIDPRWQAIHEDGTSFPGETHPAIVTLRTGKPQFNVIMGVHKPDGNLIWISINSLPLFASDKSKPSAAVVSFTDITIQKQAQIALQQQTERERMVYTIAQHIRESLDLDEILNTTVAEVRHFLQTDRVILYHFNPDWSGVVVTESVAKGYQAILNMKITEGYFVERQGQFYQQNTVKATSDIYTAGLTPCHLEFLEKLQVRAKLLVPILQGDGVWGILVAHHCSAPREWQTWEGELLQQLATQAAIAIQQSELYQQLQRANQQLEKMVMVDELTQIANRRCFDNTLNSVWQYLLREQGSISLLLCDIDYFKQYNDTYGHATGDDCLRFIAQALKQSVKRSIDLAARYGGEEFVVILPNTPSDGAFHVAQEIHKAMQQLNIPHAASAVKHHVTLSIGIATVIPTPNMVPLDLIKAADQALYQAKANGRNRSYKYSCKINGTIEI